MITKEYYKFKLVIKSRHDDHIIYEKIYDKFFEFERDIKILKSTLYKGMKVETTVLFIEEYPYREGEENFNDKS